LLGYFNGNHPLELSHIFIAHQSRDILSLMESTLSTNRAQTRRSKFGKLTGTKSDAGPKLRGSLALPLNESKKQKTDSQHQSPFFSQLPLEVRLMIYRYYVKSPGSEKLHIIKTHQLSSRRSDLREMRDDRVKLTCVRCRNPNDVDYPCGRKGIFWSSGWLTSHEMCRNACTWNQRAHPQYRTHLDQFLMSRRRWVIFQPKRLEARLTVDVGIQKRLICYVHLFPFTSCPSQLSSGFYPPF
jgi:hypothetical protein